MFQVLIKKFDKKQHFGSYWPKLGLIRGEHGPNGRKRGS